MTRLCASEGVFFFFEHDPLATLAAEGGPLEVVVFSDAPAGYSSIAGSRALRFRGDALEGGWGQDKPNEVPGAPMVRHNQDVYVGVPNPTQSSTWLTSTAFPPTIGRSSVIMGPSTR